MAENELFDKLARKLFGAVGWPMDPRPPYASEQPQAYSRVTRTPIFIRDNDLQGAGGRMWPDTGQMEVRRDEAQRGTSVISHESAHDIYNRARLGAVAPQLEQYVPDSTRAKLALNKNLYQNPDARQVSTEGLGYGIGDPEATDYVQYTASKIQNPQLREMLIRLHNNELAKRKLQGIGGMQ